MKARGFVTISASLSIGILLDGFSVSLAQTANERPQDMLAAQIRMQGFACDKPLGASKDKKRSKPDHAVWVLKCGNASYRISRAPDMAAAVTRLK
ncbi:hypothetical protein FXV83_18120 [Bradyrhizobium hipponense]|uniref:Uncharacterized protein n=1 Tax=Bradyrhizobium hipponense TaxID=2605638 RepID=A0A5S4YML5_9BRAD|nr:hypothetical protein [Bradyrhizobium hipponense]TYO65112.1 hypothetical protein FXV83_18120 [Bradyrhizobium hipponense]